jgi:hypothetical protein
VTPAPVDGDRMLSQEGAGVCSPARPCVHLHTGMGSSRESRQTWKWRGGWRHRVRTHAVRSLVRPATLWMRVVSRASGRDMDGRMVMRRRANIDLLAPGGPSMRHYGQNACITFSFASLS